jgi:hypothetical protein
LKEVVVIVVFEIGCNVDAFIEANFLLVTKAISYPLFLPNDRLLTLVSDQFVD